MFEDEERLVAKAFPYIQKGELAGLRGENTAFLICCATNSEAILRASKIKGKLRANPLVLFCSDLLQLEEYTDPTKFSYQAHKFIEALGSHDVMLIMNTASAIPNIITCGMNVTAYCMPSSRFLRQLCYLLQTPVVLVSVPVNALDEKQDQIGITIDYTPYLPKKCIVFDCREGGLLRIEANFDAIEFLSE